MGDRISRSISTLGSITVGDTFLYCTSSIDCRPPTAFLRRRVLKKISPSAFEHAPRFETGHKHNSSDPNFREVSERGRLHVFRQREGDFPRVHPIKLSKFPLSRWPLGLRKREKRTVVVIVRRL
jgi:hypothetical protein